jgi:hypothetical protein
MGTNAWISLLLFPPSNHVFNGFNEGHLITLQFCKGEKVAKKYKSYHKEKVVIFPNFLEELDTTIQLESSSVIYFDKNRVYLLSIERR